MGRILRASGYDAHLYTYTSASTPILSPSPPHALAHALAPALAGLAWGVGGSVLLEQLGLPVTPNDLDIVTTPAQFAMLTAQLEGRLRSEPKQRDPRYATAHFAHFVSAEGVGVDVMAGIAVRTATGLESWAWDPARINIADRLPWMLAEDWRHLYALFGREARVRMLADYLG